MLKRRQQTASASAETSLLDSWVSSDNHFVPTHPANASDAAAPVLRPPLSTAAATAASLLPSRRTSSGDALKRASSHGGCTSAPTAPQLDCLVPTPLSDCLPSTDLRPFHADRHITATLATPRQQTAPSQLPAAAAAPHRLTPSPSPAGAGFSLSGPDLFRGPRRADAGSAAAPAAALTPSGRASTGGGAASSAASGPPETPCPRSPEWSPRRRARSSASSRSLASEVSPPPAAASGTRAQTEGGLPYESYVSRSGRCAEWGAGAGNEGVVGGAGGIAGGEPAWVRCGGSRARGPADGPPGGGGCEEGWTSSGGVGEVARGRCASSCAAHAHAAAPLLAPDPRDLSFALGVLGAVRCAVSAARGGVGAGVGAGGRSRPPDIALGGLGGDVSSGADVGTGCGVGTVVPFDAVVAIDELKLGQDGVDAASAFGGIADSAAAAVAAAPTSILLLVLAVRVFRAAARWPAATSLCVAVTGVAAAWLAAAAALLAAAGAVARGAHLTARIALAVVSWCMGSRVVVAAALFQAARPLPPSQPPASPR